MASETAEHSPKDVAEAVAGLRVRDEITLRVGGRVLTVTRCSRKDYCVKADNQPYRARWGSFVREVLEDIEYVRQTGALPQSKAKGWF